MKTSTIISFVTLLVLVQLTTATKPKVPAVPYHLKTLCYKKIIKCCFKYHFCGFKPHFKTLTVKCSKKKCFKKCYNKCKIITVFKKVKKCYKVYSQDKYCKAHWFAPKHCVKFVCKYKKVPKKKKVCHKVCKKICKDIFVKCIIKKKGYFAKFCAKKFCFKAKFIGSTKKPKKFLLKLKKFKIISKVYTHHPW